MQIGHIDMNQLRGVGDKAVGVTKEMVGVFVGSERLQDEGQAQQERASAELKALRADLEAEKAEARAKSSEGRERAAQRAKAS